MCTRSVYKVEHKHNYESLTTEEVPLHDKTPSGDFRCYSSYSYENFHTIIHSCLLINVATT